MTNIPDKEFEILMYLRQNENTSWVDVLNTFGNYPETQRILKAMLTLGVVRTSAAGEKPPYCRLKLTDRGYQAVLAEEDIQKKVCDKMSNEKTRQKSDRRFQLLNSLLSAMVGSIIALLIEHYSTVLEGLRIFFLWLGSLF